MSTALSVARWGTAIPLPERTTCRFSTESLAQDPSQWRRRWCFDFLGVPAPLVAALRECGVTEVPQAPNPRKA